MDDEELVSAIVANNNTHLFAILYDRYALKIYQKCLSFSKSPDEAQDLTHDIFVQLFVKLRTFKGHSKFSTWLYSFTYNFCINYVQRELKKKNEKFTTLKDDNFEIKEEISDDEIFQLKADKLKASLDLLDPNDKIVLLMKYQDDFSIQDICIHLEIGESATKMRINRAKYKLIKIYNNLKQ